MFLDGPAADNGDGILGNGGEYVDFVTFKTSENIILSGYTIELHGDGAGVGVNRGTELVQLSADTGAGFVVIDSFDNNGFGGTVIRPLGGPVEANTFKLEITRDNGSGPRIVELDAIATTIPEPSTMMLLALGGLGLLRGIRRLRRS